jgi:dTDP-4-dehydrorhamnose reductase
VIKKLLVTGASGFLGWNICREAQNEWEVFGTFLSHPVEIDGTNTIQIDLTDFKELERLFHEIRPDGVIHTAAATSPNYCEDNRSASHNINVDAAVNCARLCAARGIPFIFTSTDLVFDGLNAPYKEDAPVSPVNCYGEQKVMAEEGVLKTYPAAAVCRMPLMFGDPGPAASSFYVTMKESLKDGRELKLFVDEFRTPVSGMTAAQGLLLLLHKAHGIFHLGGIERISRYNFGLLMMDVLGVSEAKIARCRQNDLKMPAPRAPDLTLDSSRAFALGFKPLPLREELQRLL